MFCIAMIVCMFKCIFIHCIFWQYCINIEMLSVCLYARKLKGSQTRTAKSVTIVKISNVVFKRPNVLSARSKGAQIFNLKAGKGPLYCTPLKSIMKIFLDSSTNHGTVCPKREFRKAFWFWKWNQNCQNCLSCTLKLIVHSWYTASPEPREMQKQKLRKSEKKNWGNLKNVKREENSTACENASCA